MTDDPRIEAVMRVMEERYPEMAEALFTSDVQAILAAADKAAWRPIDEAPLRDNVEILAYSPEVGVFIAIYCSAIGEWTSDGGILLTEGGQPTKFQYITPPESGDD